MENIAVFSLWLKKKLSELAGASVPIFKEHEMEKRTADVIKADAAIAINVGKDVRGITRPCALSSIRHFDVVSSSSIDYMHQILLGVMRTLMNLFYFIQPS